MGATARMRRPGENTQLRGVSDVSCAITDRVAIPDERPRIGTVRRPTVVSCYAVVPCPARLSVAVDLPPLPCRRASVACYFDNDEHGYPARNAVSLNVVCIPDLCVGPHA